MKYLSLAIALGAFSALPLATPATAQDHPPQNSDGDGPHAVQLVMPIMNSARGMELFIEKKCYACHSVNGVGGEDAAALDAHNMNDYMNPFDLAAKMWKMATVMIPMQEDELGAQVEFTGDELADIIAFLHDDKQQHKFTKDLLPPSKD